MSAAALDRQIRPIYDALDTGSNKSAILACNKLLKKHPNLDLLKALKALAYVRSQKVEESLVICDEVLAAKPTDDATLSAMTHVLRGLGRHTDLIKMFEEALKQEPQNEELAAQTFFANVRTGSWKAAQLIATKMHKQFQEVRYIYWNVICAILQANDAATPPNMRTLLYKLAHRLVTSSPTPSYVSADRFYLHLVILRELQLFDEANTLLESDVGKSICATSLLCDELRREIWRMRGLFQEEGQRARQRIIESKDRNWLEFVSVLDAAFPPASSASNGQNGVSAETAGETRDFLAGIAEQDGIRDRSAHLALLELERRSRDHGLSKDPTKLVGLLEKYFRMFGDKACCFEDLQPHMLLDGDDLSRWTTFLESQTSSFVDVPSIQRVINVHKMLRYNLAASQITAELEKTRAAQYMKDYFSGLPLGNDLPDTELQPADALAILTAQAYLSVWKLTGHEAQLYNAAVVLEYALGRSKHAFQMRLLLIQIYRLLGAATLALEHYRSMNVKQVQNDTLSHLILARASTFSTASTGDLTFATECLESSQIYMSNSQETSDFIVRAFTQEKYSMIPDFIAFEDRLDNSLQRDLVKVEHVRMRVTHEQINSELIDMELIELKFIFDRFHHDNRDLDIVLNYQPRVQDTVYNQTLLFDKTPGLGWLWIFLKVYIRALQQASDVDDTVEDKLLIGDRPKQSNDPENKLPLKERLAKRKQEELDELTEDELRFMNYATAMADWLQPYHDYVRPPPAAVLAEASKQTELRTGRPLQGVEIPELTNGSFKKDEEAPPVKDSPEILSTFFDDMKARWLEVVAGGKLPSEALHIATLTQEALILLTIETLRFKPASVVKVHKLGALVQSFKAIRTKAIAVMKEIAAELSKYAEQEGTSERRKAFVEACTGAQSSSQIDSDFVLNVAKRVTDARKKVLEGVGKGILRVCTNHA
ncbi:hypothetical protein JAAARDRAFT_31952 [Jaapia argillacea MUCL 33604]|uniref:Uncharacterized protein n=1 Tax=Jaapia argillacea MUCL 33604 TaxID=933084 RepID=A0A067Q4A3_9AGAM|nr:hypothetical protein JAAARDRAFT_31952 [Jaapia argillacea MUCL 33604]